MTDMPKWNWDKYNELIRKGPTSPLMKYIKELEDLIEDIATQGLCDDSPDDLWNKIHKVIDERIT